MKNTFLFFLFALFATAIGAQAPNGFYVGTPCSIEEANVTYYLTPLKIQVDQPLRFIDGQIHSSNNKNDLYRVSLSVEKVPENTWLILKIDKSYFATCLRSKTKKKKRRYKTGSEDSKLQEVENTKKAVQSTGGFVIENRADAVLIAEFLQLEIIDRQHFGHEVKGNLQPQQATYAAQPQSLPCEFTIKNTGKVPLKFRAFESTSAVLVSKRIRLKAFLNNKKLSNKQSKEKTEAYLISEFLPPASTMHPGDSVTHQLDLIDWFDFDQPGTYTIQWSFRLELLDQQRPYDKKRAPEFMWSEELKGHFTITIK